MGLCENRPEGFGPKSKFSTNLPTTCFVDVIVVPISTWVYLVAAAASILFLLSTRLSAAGKLAAIEKTSSASEPGLSKSRTILSRVLDAAYYFFIVAIIALYSLEIARLNVAKLGIGLLPFTYVGIIVALVLHISTQPQFSQSKLGRRCLGGISEARWRWTVKGVNALFWLLLMCTVAVKLAAEVKEQRVAGHRKGQQAQYPLLDEFTDDAAVIAVELIIFILELCTK